MAGDAVRALVIVDKDGERAIISHSGSGHLTTSMLDIDATLENAGALHIDGYALDSASAQAVIAVAAEAVERGIRVSMEPPSVLHLEKVLPALRRLPALDAVLGRPDELAACAGSLRTPQAVTVTHAGPGDVAVHEGRERVLVPVPAPVGALHATGAGTGSLRGG